MSYGYPRRLRLKRRPLIRQLFRRGDPEICRIRAGNMTVSARPVEASQLPQGVRVQMGVITGRDLRGVARNRRRRQLREAFREGALPILRAGVEEAIPETLGVTVLVIDARPGQRLSGARLAKTLSTSIPPLVDRLSLVASRGADSHQTR